MRGGGEDTLLRISDVPEPHQPIHLFDRMLDHQIPFLHQHLADCGHCKRASALTPSVASPGTNHPV